MDMYALTTMSSQGPLESWPILDVGAGTIWLDFTLPQSNLYYAFDFCPFFSLSLPLFLSASFSVIRSQMSLDQDSSFVFYRP